MRVGDPQARKYYLEEAPRCEWGVRDLNDEIQKMSFDRVRARQVEVVDNPCAKSPEITPCLLLKDPCVAEFLNLGRKLHGKEKKVEQRIIDNIEQFMLELGKGFTFAGRPRMTQTAFYKNWSAPRRSVRRVWAHVGRPLSTVYKMWSEECWRGEQIAYNVREIVNG